MQHSCGFYYYNPAGCTFSSFVDQLSTFLSIYVAHPSLNMADVLLKTIELYFLTVFLAFSGTSSKSHSPSINHQGS